VHRQRPLIELDHRILKQLARMGYATVDQLAYWCDVARVSISRRLEVIRGLGLVRGEEQARPAIWYLTFAGGRLVRKPMPAGRRQASWSVMAHACHTNAAEIVLRQQYNGFRFLDRLSLLKQGFNPGHGEHGARDDDGTSYFVLVDDYAMTSDRIRRSWMRRHAPNSKYWPDPTGRCWSEVVHRFLVVSTDANNAVTHRAYIDSQALPADVLTIEPLWR
jgi:hypothetical protein